MGSEMCIRDRIEIDLAPIDPVQIEPDLVGFDLARIDPVGFDPVQIDFDLAFPRLSQAGLVAGSVPDRSDLDHFDLGRFEIGQMAIVRYLSGCP